MRWLYIYDLIRFSLKIDFKCINANGFGLCSIQTGFLYFRMLIFITKTCPCSIHRFFSAVKIENVIRKILIYLIFLLKTK